VERDDIRPMPKNSLSTVNIIFRREANGIASFITYDYQVRREWLNESLVRGMTRFVKEFHNLKGWEAVCYYYN